MDGRTRTHTSQLPPSHHRYLATSESTCVSCLDCSNSAACAGGVGGVGGTMDALRRLDGETEKWLPPYSASRPAVFGHTLLLKLTCTHMHKYPRPHSPRIPSHTCACLTSDGAGAREWGLRGIVLGRNWRDLDWIFLHGKHTQRPRSQERCAPTSLRRPSKPTYTSARSYSPGPLIPLLNNPAKTFSAADPGLRSARQVWAHG